VPGLLHQGSDGLSLLFFKALHKVIATWCARFLQSPVGSVSMALSNVQEAILSAETILSGSSSPGIRTRMELAKSQMIPSTEHVDMQPDGDLTTSVLFIDANEADRKFFTEGLKGRSDDYRILEATDGDSGLALYRSQRIDCVILELDFPNRSGFEFLIDLVPFNSRINVAVIILTRLKHLGIWDLARKNGAYACLVKQHTSREALDHVIRRAIATVGMLSKEDQDRLL
jgi:CheY-like chemotaxis protein